MNRPPLSLVERERLQARARVGLELDGSIRRVARWIVSTHPEPLSGVVVERLVARVADQLQREARARAVARLGADEAARLELEIATANGPRGRAAAGF